VPDGEGDLQVVGQFVHENPIPFKDGGFMDPLGTTFQSAMADLKEAAMSSATRMEKAQLFQMGEPFFSQV
jgi:hypothetical protein